MRVRITIEADIRRPELVAEIEDAVYLDSGGFWLEYDAQSSERAKAAASGTFSSIKVETVA